MRILLLGITHPLTQKLAEQLVTRNHTLTTVSPEPSPLSHASLTHIQDDPARNGQWQQTVRGQIDVIINATFPSSPASRFFNAEKESDHLVSVTRELSNLTKEGAIKYIQLIPINTFPANGQTPLNTELLSSEYTSGWGSAYAASAKLARQSFTQRHEIIFGQLLYNTEGEIYSTNLPALTLLTMPINDPASTLTTTHESDLINTICYTVEQSIPQTNIFTMPPEQITQKAALELFSKKQNKTYLNIPLPISIASTIFGESATTWSTHYTSPQFTLQEYNQFLQFPTLKSGLHLA